MALFFKSQFFNINRTAVYAMHDSNNELSIQFLNFDCFKVIVENAGLYSYVYPNNDKILRETFRNIGFFFFVNIVSKTLWEINWFLIEENVFFANLTIAFKNREIISKYQLGYWVGELFKFGFRILFQKKKKFWESHSCLFDRPVIESWDF